MQISCSTVIAPVIKDRPYLVITVFQRLGKTRATRRSPPGTAVHRSPREAGALPTGAGAELAPARRDARQAPTRSSASPRPIFGGVWTGNFSAILIS